MSSCLHSKSFGLFSSPPSALISVDLISVSGVIKRGLFSSRFLAFFPMLFIAALGGLALFSPSFLGGESKPILDVSTLSTSSPHPPITVSLHASIIWSVFMAIAAMGLPCIDSRYAVGSHSILSGGYGLKVSGVAAGSVFAQVVNLKSSRYWSVDDGTRESMNEVEPSSLSKVSIPIFVHRSLPHPTARFGDQALGLDRLNCPPDKLAFSHGGEDSRMVITGHVIQ